MSSFSTASHHNRQNSAKADGAAQDKLELGDRRFYRQESDVAKIAREAKRIRGSSPSSRVEASKALNSLIEVSEDPTEQLLLKNVKNARFRTSAARASAYHAAFSLLSQSGSHVGNVAFRLTEENLAKAGLSALHSKSLYERKEDAVAPFFKTITSITSNPTTKSLIKASRRPEYGFIRETSMYAALTIIAGNSHRVSTTDEAPKVFLEAADIAHVKSVYREKASAPFLQARRDTLDPGLIAKLKSKLFSS